MKLSLLGLISFVVRVLQLGVAAATNIVAVLSLLLFLVASNDQKSRLINVVVSSHEVHIAVLNDSSSFLQGRCARVMLALLAAAVLRLEWTY